MLPRMPLSAVAARLCALWRAVVSGRRLDAEMDEEMRHHIELQAERLCREQGLDPAEARRRAHVAFGGVEAVKAEARDVRGVRWLDALVLDGRLAGRMLLKYPGLTIVGGLAVAVAIAIGATSFVIISQAVRPDFPIAGGDRLMAVIYNTENPGNPERRLWADLQEWRGSIESLEHLGAFRRIEHTLTGGIAASEPVRVAEMSAAGFAVAASPPLVGRHLLEDDERPGAPLVLVISHRAWQMRFAGDASIVGRAVTLGGVPHTVVGVMPEGFRFPVNHDYWTPLRLDAAHHDRLDGPVLHVFARLKPGVSVAQAQAELATITARNAAADPAKYGRLHLALLPYTMEHSDIDEPAVAWMLGIVQVLISMLVVVVSLNLAILVYARTMARMGELAVRSALGATRKRILAQLFLEAAALTGVGALIGLTLADVVLEQLQALLSPIEAVPFWFQLDLNVLTMAYGLGMAILAAILVGVLPGIRATGSAMHAHLREATAGSGGARLGGTWTLLVVAQVAIAVAALPLAIFIVWHVVRADFTFPGFPVDQFVTAEIAMNDPAPLRARHAELIRRLEAEPGIAAVTFSSAVPGRASAYRRLEFDGGPPVEDAERRNVAVVLVGTNMLDVYQAGVIAGRTFEAADTGRPVLVVNRAFVNRLMGGGAVLGQRVRFSRTLAPPERDPGEWRDIVGVVDDFPAVSLEPGVEGDPTVYHPVAAGEAHPFTLAVRAPAAQHASIIARVRAIGVEVDPALQVSRLMSLTDAYDRQRRFGRMLAAGLAVVTLSVLLLSAAGIYALMSFTVAQRAREIGIRAALGAQPRRLLASVFGRALVQLGAGVTVGSVLSAAILSNTELSGERQVLLVFAVAAILVSVGGCAAAGPARNGLRIQAADVLRGD